MGLVSKVPFWRLYKKMDKDSVANVVSYAGVGAVLMEYESILTIVLLISGIALNVLRIRSMNKSKKDE